MRYTLIRTKRQTVALEIPADGRLIVRAPARMPVAEIERLLAEKAGWIEKHMQKARVRLAARPAEPTEEERLACIRRARKMLPVLLNEYGSRMGVRPTGMTVTGARTRWGSCSPANRISFSWRLMRMPDAFIEYVAVHELAHIVEKNHGPRFYALVAAVLPDWRARRALGK